MTRTPEEIIKAILANLEMARDVADRRWSRSAREGFSDYQEQGRFNAFKEVITLIKTEAVSILAAQEK